MYLHYESVFYILLYRLLCYVCMCFDCITMYIIFCKTNNISPRAACLVIFPNKPILFYLIYSTRNFVVKIDNNISLMNKDNATREDCIYLFISYFFSRVTPSVGLHCYTWRSCIQ